MLRVIFGNFHLREDSSQYRPGFVFKAGLDGSWEKGFVVVDLPAKALGTLSLDEQSKIKDRAGKHLLGSRIGLERE